MKDYDLYKYITGLSGVGVCRGTGKPTLDDDVWERLMTAKPKHRAKIAANREQGFLHTMVCCLIAALAAALRQQETGSDSENENGDRIRDFPVSDPSTTAPPCPSSGTEEPASSTQTPCSQQQRIGRVKRIREGALKSTRDQKKKKSNADITNALTSLVRTTKAYVKVKMSTHKSQDHAKTR
ncbi:hypothetical protein PHYPSEUDO_013239 [Phytophthora pseudosyringae]|uniref:Uncharacterized protein n=1 Tax=Phytophthora pseudosyringae TaxID=221518 RepID=A0A8T1W2Y9_9STRA|nr:hypothetical protein PHYPSEUDO_013239 [Phytophthora pseudosyringae]